MDDLEKAADLLKRGEALILPTETVYGLAASALDASAINKIFEIKGRPRDNPLIVHVSSIEQAESISSDLPEEFYLLARRFWPGPLTLVVKRGEGVPEEVSAGHPTIAIRMPSHPIARKVIELAGPLAAPSANLSGKPSPTNLKDALEDLEGRVAGAIDGGACQVGLESTVLSLYEDEPMLLRPGSITKEVLEGALGRAILLATPDTKVHSPGMKYRHYAPKARLKLVDRREDLRGDFTLSCIEMAGAKKLSEQTFYALLREADRLGVEEIEVYMEETLIQNAALMNRLLRAAGLLG